MTTTPANSEEPPVLRARWIERISTAFAIVSGTAIVLLMLITTVDVVKRKLFERGLAGAIEVTEVVLVAVVFTGMMSAELSRAHIRTPILTERLSARVASLARLLGNLLAAGLVGWAVVQTTDAGLHSYETGEFRFGVTHVPVWPAKLIIPIGLAGLFLALMMNVFFNLRALVQARGGTTRARAVQSAIDARSVGAGREESDHGA